MTRSEISRILIYTLTAIALGACAASATEVRDVRAPDTPQSRPDAFVEVPYHSQLDETDSTRWNPNTTCGPAALLMVLHALELEENLDVVIEAAAAIPHRQGGYDPACSPEGNPVCTSPAALVSVARDQYGLDADAHDGWTLDDVRRALASGKPVIADVNVDLDPSATGHFVVIIGYSEETGEARLTYHDPFREPDMNAAWTTFTRSWSGPIDLDDPVQPEGHVRWGMVVSFRGSGS